jgi:hypothetical protein
MTYEFLKVSVEERVAWIEYQRPPVNAVDWKMLGVSRSFPPLPGPSWSICGFPPGPSPSLQPPLRPSSASGECRPSFETRPTLTTGKALLYPQQR